MTPRTWIQDAYILKQIFFGLEYQVNNYMKEIEEGIEFVLTLNNKSVI